MNTPIHVHPIGHVRRDADRVWIDLDAGFEEGLLGLDGFSHITVLYWFDQNDTPSKRRTLQVHPMKDPAKPLTGVFATHSPMRPNLIAVTICKLKAIDGLRLYLEDMDALDGSPVLDIKCYIPRAKVETNVIVPDWVLAAPE